MLLPKIANWTFLTPQQRLAALTLATSLGIFIGVVTEASWGQTPLDELKGLPEEALQAGKIALFDQATLYGLTPLDKTNWKVVDKVLVGEGSSKSPAQIRPDIQFGVCQLQITFKASDEVVLYFQGRPRPTRDEIGKSGNAVFLNGKSAPIPSLTDAAGWQTVVITISAESVEVTSENESSAAGGSQSTKPLGRGFLVLETTGKLEVKEWLLQPLGQESLFDGKTLAGWKSREDLTGEFTVEDSNLKIRGGRGQLEHEKELGDFVLQLEAKVANQEENSGLFFRCIPGDIMMGYESQICHAILDGDRTKPKDCGTGGIFRRQNARVVLPEGDAWFYKTIIAEGPNIGVWVNGILVTRWTDKRKPDENPRRGYRAAAGTIMLQAHDPTTDLTLRKITAREIDKRK